MMKVGITENVLKPLGDHRQLLAAANDARVYARSSGDLLPPAEKATASRNQARQTSTGEGLWRNPKERGGWG
jgi:hypothetical protein